VTIPISIDNNRNSRSVQSTENDEYEMADLIAEGTILAVYTDESDSNYYLLRASSCPQVLTKDTTDDWGITYGSHFILVVFRALNRSRIPVIINRYWNCHVTSNGIVFTVIIITSNTVFTRITRHIANC
jgi:hypothetical protein